ncbi:MAG TPA: hypothetical protein DEQ56_10155, partial [Bacteroidetes bacterium]|nr:hypothetical protein [Bacteroidota bacterium]
MEHTVKSFINSTQYKQLTKYNLHHVLLWLVYFMFWVYVLSPGSSTLDFYINSFVIVTIHALVSYFNIYFLFPVFLQKRDYLKYFAAISLTISLGTFLESG